jgi:serine/threonine protein kinase
MVIEYADGSDLFTKYNEYYAQTGTTFSEEKSLTWMTHLILGLAHIHISVFMHRDIKPNNVLIS